MTGYIDLHEGVADLIETAGYAGVTNRLLEDRDEGITVRRYPGAGISDEYMDGTSDVPVNVQIITRRLSELQAMTEGDELRALLFHQKIGRYSPIHIYVEPQRIKLDDSGLTAFELIVQASTII